MPRPWQWMPRAVIALALVAGVLAMHGLSGPLSTSMTTGSPMGALHDTKPGHAGTPDLVAAKATPPALSATATMKCAEHPCVGTLRTATRLASPALLANVAEPPGTLLPLMSEVVGPRLRAPPEAVSLTRLCVCRT